LRVISENADGTWERTSAATTANSGFSPSLVASPGTWSVAHVDGTTLKFSQKLLFGFPPVPLWFPATIDTTLFGAFPRCALDRARDGTYGIVYTDSESDLTETTDIHYAERPDSLWSSACVATGVINAPFAQRDYGRALSLRFDLDSTPLIAFLGEDQDFGGQTESRSAYFGRRAPSGAWALSGFFNIYPVDTDPVDLGFTVNDSGMPFLVYVESTGTEPGVLTWSRPRGGAWLTSAAPTTPSTPSGPAATSAATGPDGTTYLLSSFPGSTKVTLRVMQDGSASDEVLLADSHAYERSDLGVDADGVVHVLGAYGNKVEHLAIRPPGPIFATNPIGAGGCDPSKGIKLDVTSDGTVFAAFYQDSHLRTWKGVRSNPSSVATTWTMEGEWNLPGIQALAMAAGPNNEVKVCYLQSDGIVALAAPGSRATQVVANGASWTPQPVLDMAWESPTAPCIAEQSARTGSRPPFIRSVPCPPISSATRLSTASPCTRIALDTPNLQPMPASTTALPPPPGSSGRPMAWMRITMRFRCCSNKPSIPSSQIRSDRPSPFPRSRAPAT
jgi:hypothetical protein